MFGVFVVLIGIALLLNSVGIIGADISIGTFWPVILIVYGIVRIINYNESTFFGIIVLVIGVFFQLRNFNVPYIKDLSFAGILLPIIIVVVGLGLLFPGGKNKQKEESENKEEFKYKEESEHKEEFEQKEESENKE